MNQSDPSDKKTKVLEFFEEGKRFTEDVLKENEKLRMINANLQAEKRDLESRYVKVSVPQVEQKNALLQEENRQLRAENEELKTDFCSIASENSDFAERYVKVERQNSDLINMYVASCRLHSTLDYNEVIRICKEIVMNMIGAEKFAIFLAMQPGNRLIRVAEEGFSGNDDITDTEIDLLYTILHSGELYTVDDAALWEHGGATPIACVPLKISNDVFGAISIHQLLVQKGGFDELDFELFELLGEQAATALYASNLYSRSEHKGKKSVDLIKPIQRRSATKR